MAFRQRREKLRSILNGSTCIRPGSVYDATSIRIAEDLGKMKAALDGRGDPWLVVIGRTGAVSVSGLDDAIARAKAYEAIGVDALFFTGIKSRNELEAISAATRLPIVLGAAPEEMTG